MNEILSYCKSNSYYDTISGDVVWDLLNGEMNDFDYYYDFSFSDIKSYASDLPPITSSVKDELKKYGVPEEYTTDMETLCEFLSENETEFSDEIKQAISATYSNCSTIGAQNEAYDDATRYIQKYFSNFKNVYEPFSYKVKLIDAADWMLSNNNEYSNNHIFEDAVKNSIADDFVEEWDFSEPRYGWSGFAEDDFMTLLSDYLYEYCSN